MIYENCILRRLQLPLVPCDEKRCDWYIYEQSCNNCFWVLSELFADKLLEGLTFEEIAKMENTTVAEVCALYESALAKCRKDTIRLEIEKEKEE